MNGLMVCAPTICLSSLKFTQNFHNHFYPSKFFRTRAYPKFRCIKNENQNVVPEGFSVLKSDTPCDGGNLWSSMAFYLFSVHVPLSFGGLSAVTSILDCSALDPQTEALSLVVLQTLELIGFLLLLRYPGNPPYKLRDFFQEKQSARDRNWLLASAVGFGFLVLLVFTSSIIADWLIGTKGCETKAPEKLVEFEKRPRLLLYMYLIGFLASYIGLVGTIAGDKVKEVNNPILKEILSSGPISITSCILVYCVITPLLEEIVYRGFFLTALSSTMKWQQAVIVSSVVFSAAHFSAENFIQLFIIGLILGCCYNWSGDLRSSIVIHSLYNALTLLITYAS